MSSAKLGWWLGAYALALALASGALYFAIALDRAAEDTLATVVSVWQRGERRARAVTSSDASALLVDEARGRGAERVLEEVVDEGPVLPVSFPLFGASFEPGIDGLKVAFRDQVAYATPDDLLKHRAYEANYKRGDLKVPLGLDRDAALSLLADELQVSPETLLRDGRFSRVAVRRRTAQAAQRDDLKPETLQSAVLAAAHYLARSVHDDGSFRYEIDALTDEDVPGYNWPRHAGATWFLAQVAGYAHDEKLANAAARAAYHLIDNATRACGADECVGDGDQVNLGSAALALLAYVELVQSGVAPELKPRARALAKFVRSLQREDGEFMHEYDVPSQQRIDVQRPYFAGEAALALARAYGLTGDPRDLEAAKRALASLVERPAAFVTWRYFWTAEHWTCQALAELWERAPNRRALEFCLAWQEANRKTMVDDGVAPGYDGVQAVNPVGAPRFTGSASRMEAAVATLATARRAGVPEREIRALEEGLERTLSFLLRAQFRPGPTHLMPDSKALHGGFPGGVTDLHVRIDFPQHAGAALLRYLRLVSAPAPAVESSALQGATPADQRAQGRSPERNF